MRLQTYLGIQYSLVREDGRLERLTPDGVGHPVGHLRGWMVPWELSHGCAGGCHEFTMMEVRDEVDQTVEHQGVRVDPLLPGSGSPEPGPVRCGPPVREARSPVLGAAVTTPKQRVTRLKDQRKQLMLYCASKLASGDLHAVQDAASDMRELDAQLDLLRDLEDDDGQ